MPSPHPAPQLRLYHRWKCPWCAAARQAIDNVGVAVELVEVPYPRAERTMVVAASGQPRVPVLIDAGDVVVDSRHVVRHLYERYGGPDFAAEAAELAAAATVADEGDFDACAIPPRPAGT